MKFTGLQCLGLAGLLTLAGCGKSETADVAADPADPAMAEATPEETAPAPAPPPVEGEGPENLRGERAVRAALANKDYNGAVGLLMNMRGTLRREQWADYVNLQGETREALMIAAESDRKAAEALMSLRALISGR